MKIRESISNYFAQLRQSPRFAFEMKAERLLSIIRLIIFVLFMLFGPMLPGINFFSLSFVIFSSLMGIYLLSAIVILWVMNYYHTLLKYVFITFDFVAIFVILLLSHKVNEWLTLLYFPFIATYCIIYLIPMAIYLSIITSVFYYVLFYIAVRIQHLNVAYSETIITIVFFCSTAIIGAVVSRFHIRQTELRYVKARETEKDLVKAKEDVLALRAKNRELESDLNTRIEELNRQKDESEQRRLEAETRAWQVATIHNVAAAVNSSVELSQILEITVEKIARILDIERVDLIMFESTDDIGYLRSTYGREGTQFNKLGTAVVNRENPFVQMMSSLKRGIALEQTTRLRDEWILLRKLMKEQGFTALLLLPIIIKNELIGIVQLNETRRNKVFSPQDLSLYETLIEQASNAIERGLLIKETLAKTEELKQANKLIAAEIKEKTLSEARLAQLAKVANTILTALDLNKVFNLVARSIVEYCGFNRCLISILEPNEVVKIVGHQGVTEEELEILRSKPMTEGERSFVFNDVFRRSQTYYIPKEIPLRASLDDLPKKALVEEIIKRTAWDPQDYLFVPFFSSNQDLLGFISLDDPQDHLVPNEKKLEPVEAFAQQVTFAIEHVKIYDALQAKLEEIQEAYDQLVEVDKLKSDFLSVVSHELRTPLTSIKSFTEILIDEIEDNEDADQSYLRFLNIIEQEADRLHSMIDDILSFQKMQEGSYKWKLEEMDVGQSLRVAANKIAPKMANADIKFNLQISNELPKFIGDDLKIKEAFTNLMSNALKFTNKNGKVDCQLYSTETAIIFKIRDTGIGIAKEKQTAIFEKFRQADGSAKRKVGGVGLGLAIVKEIVDKHKGRIDVKSEENVGSEFTLIFPRTDI